MDIWVLLVRHTAQNGLLGNFNACENITGNTQQLNFTDSNRQQRYACLLITASLKPLPLLVWLHSSLAPASTVVLTNLVPEAQSANLTGTVNGSLGYHLLLPYGRDTTHMYPPPDQTGLGWDNWYRNYNRSDPGLNVDVQTIDYFIANVLSNVVNVDRSRVFMSGWSNGAAMAVEYALNTPNIAAVAAYSAPDPYRDINDPCAQVPTPSYFTPILIVFNECDVFGICTTGSAFIADLNKRYPHNLTAQAVIIDILYNQNGTNCIPACSTNQTIGVVNHMRWPVPINDPVFFNFFRKYHSS